jgi:hypothetical protein
VIHPTYRLLDAPIKFAGLALRQWVMLLVGGGAFVGMVHLIGIPTKPAISLCTIVIGVPTIVAYASEETGLSISTVVRDVVGWRLAPRAYAAGAAVDPRGVVIEGPEHTPDDAAVAAGVELEELLAL